MRRLKQLVQYWLYRRYRRKIASPVRLTKEQSEVVSRLLKERNPS